MTPASTTTVASDNPEIIRFRGGKLLPSGGVPGARRPGVPGSTAASVRGRAGNAGTADRRAEADGLHGCVLERRSLRGSIRHHDDVLGHSLTTFSVMPPRAQRSMPE